MSAFIPLEALEELLEAVVFVDSDKRTSYVNKHFEKIFNISRQKAIGQKIELLVKTDNNWNWNLVLKEHLQLTKNTVCKSPNGDINLTITALPIPNIDKNYSYLFYINEAKSEAQTDTTSFPDMNRNELMYIAALPEMSNSANSWEEFLSRAQLKFLRTYKSRAIATWTYNQLKKLTLAGFQCDGVVSRDSCASWFKEHAAHMEEVLQVDLPKKFHSKEFSFVAIPHKKRNSMFAVTLLAKDKDTAVSESEIKVLQIYGNQLAVSYENTKLQEVSTVDALTGLFNAKFFHSRISSEFLIAKQTESPLSLVMFDVDHFKKFNDTYGHTTGDLVLSEVSRIIKKTCRSSDIVCRYGGEEFALILIDTSEKGAHIVAEKIRAAVEAHIPDPSRPEMRVTISLGIATFPELASSKEALVEHADEALYSAKQAGRNNVVVYQK